MQKIVITNIPIPCTQKLPTAIYGTPVPITLGCVAPPFQFSSPSMRIFLQKAYSYLVTLLAFLPQPCNQGTPPGADV